VTSIAVLMISANKMKKMEDIKIARSRKGIDQKARTTNATAARLSSCLNAASFLVSQLNARSEFFRALNTRRRPFGLLLGSKCEVVLTTGFDSFRLRIV